MSKKKLETRLWSVFLEPLIDFLAYVESQLCLKKKQFDKNQKV